MKKPPQPNPPPSTDGEPDMDPVGKKAGGAIAKKARGKKPKNRSDKKART